MNDRFNSQATSGIGVVSICMYLQDDAGCLDLWGDCKVVIRWMHCALSTIDRSSCHKARVPARLMLTVLAPLWSCNGMVFGSWDLMGLMGCKKWVCLAPLDGLVKNNAFPLGPQKLYCQKARNCRPCGYWCLLRYMMIHDDTI